MRNKHIIFLCIGLFTQFAYGQTDDKIMKISYTATPFSQYQLKANSSRPQDELNNSLALKNGYKYYYTLYVNPRTGQSVFKFEDLKVNKPKGQEVVELQLNDELDYCVKTNSKNYFKFEKLFKKPFYSNGTMKDLEWVITNEKKIILGFDCTKAIAKNKDYLISVWFTEKIPVPSGPSNYFGLPGLVVWSEDFFRTTQIVKIEYIDEKTFSIPNEIVKIKSDFEKNKKNSEIQEKLFLEKKLELIKSMMAMMR